MPSVLEARASQAEQMEESQEVRTRRGFFANQRSRNPSVDFLSSGLRWRPLLSPWGPTSLLQSHTCEQGHVTSAKFRMDLDWLSTGLRLDFEFRQGLDLEGSHKPCHAWQC